LGFSNAAGDSIPYGAEKLPMSSVGTIDSNSSFSVMNKPEIRVFEKPLFYSENKGFFEG
jgi:hypothetical protein